MPQLTRFVIVIGVSGSGKTTVSRLLSEQLGWAYYDADDYHSIENITKMAKGKPLTDFDREPWLDRLRDLIIACLVNNRPGVLACSALKEKYRRHLIGDRSDIQIVYLKGNFDVIWLRLNARTNHYMKPALLQSQFEVLEEPLGALVVDVCQEPGEICKTLLARIHPSVDLVENCLEEE
jgi:gluconokinase